MRVFIRRICISLTAVISAFALTSCSAVTSDTNNTDNSITDSVVNPAEDEAHASVHSAVDFNHKLDSYTPKKKHYNFYFTYKTVHPWWDAVALGMEDAQRQYLDKGIKITYEYMAPPSASASDQTKKLLDAKNKDYDVIGVDVADEDIISHILDSLAEDGTKIMTFSSSDAAPGCKRSQGYYRQISRYGDRRH